MSMKIEDNMYIEEYNRGITKLNHAFSNLKSLDDYRERSKYRLVEEALATLDATLKKFSDQKDPQVTNLRNSINNMRTSYEQNYAMAHDGAELTYGDTKVKVTLTTNEPEPAALLTERIDAFNQIMRDATSAYNAMAPLDELTAYKETIETVLDEIKAVDIETYMTAKAHFAPWLDLYTQISSEIANDSSQVDTMSTDQRIKTFRSLFIANDYAFRNIDLIQFQDKGYRDALEDTLKELQELLEPIRSSTTDTMILRADADLRGLEAIFNDATRESSKMASSVENIEEALQAIQDVFDPNTFELTLEKDIFIDDFINSQEEVQEWTEMLKHYKKLAPSMMEFLERVRDSTLEGQSQKFLSYYTWFKNSVPGGIDDLIENELQGWNHAIIIGVKPLENLGSGLEIDIKSQSYVYDLHESYILGKKYLENLACFEETLYGDLSEKTKSYLEKYDQLSKILEKAAVASLQEQRLRERHYDRPELIAIAQRLMQESGRSYGEISHMHVVTDLSPRNRVDLIEDMQSGVKYFVKQNWEIFNIEFVEKQEDKYYIIFGSFRRNIQVSDAFEKYGTEWIINGINQIEHSVEILQENLPQSI